MSDGMLASAPDTGGHAAPLICPLGHKRGSKRSNLGACGPDLPCVFDLRVHGRREFNGKGHSGGRVVTARHE